MIRMLAALLLWVFIMWLSAPAQASPVVGDISNYSIDIDAGFNGTKLFLFGVRNNDGDIIVVLRGENKNYIVRKKEKVAGIWVNKDRMKFFDVPSFYWLAGSKKTENIEFQHALAQLGIGQNHLLARPSDPKKQAYFADFSQAFLRHQLSERRYAHESASINFMAETLFKTTIDLPSNLPPGAYTAEIYLVSGGEISGMQSIPLNVVKTGLDAFIYNAAHDSPALYGLCTILLALGAGWFAGRLFQTS